MEMIAGLIAAIAIVGLGYATRQERLLPFYSTALIVIALVYVLFAVMAATPHTIIVESLIAAAFVGVALTAAQWANTRTAGLILAAGLAAHGVYDLVHSAVVSNPVVPTWWPLFCGVVDLLLGGWLIVLLERGALVTPPAEGAVRSS